MLPQHKEVLQNCSVEGMVVKLPAGQLDRKLYQEVAKSLELIGGKWKGGKVMGFVFNEDPTELLAEIATGEKRNLKKEFQFFATPAHIADQLVQLANPQKGQRVIEPSAGNGAIVKAITRFCPEIRQVNCCELMPTNRMQLEKIDEVLIIADDFMDLEQNAFGNYFDSIIANPPFANNQDIDHIKKMYECCKEGGRIVSVSSSHWKESNNKKETEFRSWLNKVGAQVHELEAGAFKESGTMVKTLIIVIDKRVNPSFN